MVLIKMCKLSGNIVPNVYNSLQSSFLSLAWPWPGRSLPQGNQWEWWDPQQRPLPTFGEVSHSPRGMSESAGTWTGAQCHQTPSPLATSNASLTPLHPWPAPPPSRNPNAPLCHLYPSWPHSTYIPCQPPIHPWHLYTAASPHRHGHVHLDMERWLTPMENFYIWKNFYPRGQLSSLYIYSWLALAKHSFAVSQLNTNNQP